MLRPGGVWGSPHTPPFFFLEVFMPWYNQQYAAGFGALFEGAGNIFSSTMDAIYSDKYSDVLAVFFSSVIFAVVAAVFFYFWRNTKK